MVNISYPAKIKFFLIIKIWVAYFLLTKIALTQPHWNLPFFHQLNYNLYFLIFLLSTIIFIKDKNNSFIYLNFAILSLLYLTGFFAIFTGKGYLLGDDYLQYYFWSYRKISISFVLSGTLIFFTINYLFRQEKTFIKYFSTLIIILPFVFFSYYKFLLNYRLIFLDNSLYELLSSAIAINFLAIFFIVLYGYLCIHRNQPISRHINLLVFSSLIFILIDTTDNFFLFYDKELPSISQVFLTGNLLLYIGILADKISYMNSDFGRFYEDLINSKIKLNMKILPKKTIIDKYILYVKEKLKSVHKRIFYLALMVLTLSFFVFYFPFGYIKVNVLILIFMISILLIYLNILLSRRTRKKI